MFRTLSDRTTIACISRSLCSFLGMSLLTFIFAYILERKRQASVLTLDDADLPKGSFADDS